MPLGFVVRYYITRLQESRCPANPRTDAHIPVLGTPSLSMVYLAFVGRGKILRPFFSLAALVLKKTAASAQAFWRGGLCGAVVPFEAALQATETGLGCCKLNSRYEKAPGSQTGVIKTAASPWLKGARPLDSEPHACGLFFWVLVDFGADY